MRQGIPEDQLSEILVAREKNPTVGVRVIQNRFIAGVVLPRCNPVHVEFDPA